MGTVLNSLDNMLASAADNGPLVRLLEQKVPSTTAALATCGGVSWQRSDRPFTVPSVGAGLTGVAFPTIDFLQSSSVRALMAALEYSLGSINLATNVFTSGVTMPTKTVRGVSVQTASLIPIVHVKAAVTGTVVLTITYTNQGGTTGKTATLTLPANAVAQSAFLIAPHLASGDTGIQAVTNLTQTGGTAGTLEVLGLLPLAYTEWPQIGGFDTIPFLQSPHPIYVAAAGDVIGFHNVGGNSAQDWLAMLVGVAEN